MGATLLAFSYNVLVGIELIGGAPLPQEQQDDYLALWRYIGWLLGVDSTTLDPCRDTVSIQSTLAFFGSLNLRVALLCDRPVRKPCSSPS